MDALPSLREGEKTILARNKIEDFLDGLSIKRAIDMGKKGRSTFQVFVTDFGPDQIRLYHQYDQAKLAFEAPVSRPNYLGSGRAVNEPFGLKGIAGIIAPGQNTWQVFFFRDVVDEHSLSLSMIAVFQERHKFVLNE
jgi:hypothetical protein